MKKSNKNYCYIILIVLCVAAYANSLSNGFVYDDETIIVNNAKNLSLSKVPYYLASSKEFAYSFGSFYRPVTLISLALDNNLWGTKPFGFHVTNLIFHILAVIVLFKLLLLLLGSYEYGLLSALIASVIFAVHPVHTEAVSFISSRTDVLTALFFFLSFLYYIKLRKPALTSPVKTSNKNLQKEKVNQNFKKYLILSLIFYSLGLLSKEMIITLPVIFILFDFVFLKFSFRELSKNIKIYLLFFAVTAVYLLIRYYAVKGMVDKPQFFWFYGRDSITAIATVIKIIPEYFRLLLFPVALIYNYNGIVAYSNQFTDLPVILSIGFILVLLVLVFVFNKKNPAISFSILFFFVTLIPVLHIIPMDNLMAERFLYLTSFALSFAVAFILIKYLNKSNAGNIVFFVSLVAVLFVYLSFDRNKDWKDNYTLYMSAEGRNSTHALINVASIYTQNNKLDKAKEMYIKAIELNDNSINAHQNLGILYMVRGQNDSAEARFKKAQSIDPEFVNSYYLLAKLYMQWDKNDLAVAELKKMEKLKLVYKDSKAILDSLNRLEK